MSLSRHRFGNSPMAVPASSLVLIVVVVTGYCFQCISYGMTIALLVVLPLAIYLARNTLNRELERPRRYMKLIMALSLVLAALIAMHLLPGR